MAMMVTVITIVGEEKAEGTPCKGVYWYRWQWKDGRGTIESIMIMMLVVLVKIVREEKRK